MDNDTVLTVAVAAMIGIFLKTVTVSNLLYE